MTPRSVSRISVLRRQAGLTLVELMVAMAVGLLITVAAGSLYLVARQGFRTNDDQSRAFETGRFAVEFLGRNIRMAGAPSFQPNTPLQWFVPTTAAPVQGTEGGAAPDTLTIAYRTVGAYNAATLVGADCLGQNAGAEVVNTFSVSADGQLMCQGNGGATVQPLATQVVDMQVTYGVAADADAGQVVSVVNATGVADWRAVRQVEICIDVVSFEPNVINGATPGLNCRGQAFPNDNRVHRLFRTVANVRNGTRGNIFTAIP